VLLTQLLTAWVQAIINWGLLTVINWSRG
jgi:hypothetical protein